MIKIKQNSDIFMAMIFLVSLCFTTIVYSAFNTQLQIRGDAIVKSDQIIRLTDLKQIETVNNAYEVYNSKYEKDTTSLYVVLPEKSSITYEVKITNKSNELYILKEIIPLINNNSEVKIEYSIKENDFISNDNSKTFTMKLSNDGTSEQTITLINQYTFERVDWLPLETQFLSTYNSGDLSESNGGVIFEYSVTNLNPYSVDYLISSDNLRFKIVDDNTNTNNFTLKPNETKTHKVRVTLRNDVTYEKYVESLKLMVRTVYPVSSKINVQTVLLNLPQYFKAVVLNSMPITDSPKNFTGIENTNGYLLRINDLNESLYTYYYRGVINDNYVSFADQLWRIVRVDANGNVRLVLNTNVSESVQYSQNYVSGNVENLETATSLTNYKNSNVRNAVENWFNQNILPKAESKYLVNSNFCINMEYQGPIDTKDGHTVYYYVPYLHVGRDSHIFSPDFTCPPEKVFTSPVGLLSGEEILAAGGYWEGVNTGYYLYNPNIAHESQTSWTLSASYYSVSEKQAGIIVFNQGGRGLFDWVGGGNLSQYYGYRPVISLNGNVKVLGDGTIDNPYTIVE